MPPADHLPSEKLTFQLSLRRRGISDRTVLRAMEEVPRDLFVEAHDRDAALRPEALFDLYKISHRTASLPVIFPTLAQK